MSKIKNYIIIALLISVNVCFFKEYKRTEEEIKQLEAEQARLIKKESQLIGDITKRSEELGVKNEALKNYIQVLEEQKDDCLSTPVNDNIRELLNEAGI